MRKALFSIPLKAWVMWTRARDYVLIKRALRSQVVSFTWEEFQAEVNRNGSIR
jgi:hypothetical protein